MTKKIEPSRYSATWQVRTDTVSRQRKEIARYFLKASAEQHAARLNLPYVMAGEKSPYYVTADD